MAFTLRKAILSDAPALTEIYLSAFQKDEISLLVLPRNNSSSYNWWHESVIEELSDPNTHFLCITTPSSSSPPKEKLIAYAKWNSPSEGEILPDLLSDLNVTWPAGGDVGIANLFFGTLLEKRRENMGARRHWYLEVLCTLPEYQAKGAAGKLLRWGIERADEEGVECYLEASPVGKGVYEHFGFREVGRLEIKLPMSEETFVEGFMIRDARWKEMEGMIRDARWKEMEGVKKGV